MPDFFARRRLLWTTTEPCAPSPAWAHCRTAAARRWLFPYVPVQKNDPERYSQQDALKAGTLFPGLNLPFHAQMKTKFPAVNTALSELMALDFAIDELGLYLTTHPEDTEVLNLYWSYIKLGREGREAYEKQYGPILQTDVTPGSFKWLNDPWPWDLEGEK